MDHLSNQIGGRLSGSENAEKAVAYTQAEMEKAGLDSVWLQPVMVPKWERGAAEEAYIIDSDKKRIKLNVCALGGSVATSEEGLTSELIEVKGIEELKALGAEKVSGKIVFYNRPMDPTLIHTFKAYGGCVDQRYQGALEALFSTPGFNPSGIGVDYWMTEGILPIYPWTFSNLSYSIRNKPAEQIVRKWFEQP